MSAGNFYDTNVSGFGGGGTAEVTLDIVVTEGADIRCTQHLSLNQQICAGACLSNVEARAIKQPWCEFDRANPNEPSDYEVSVNVTSWATAVGIVGTAHQVGFLKDVQIWVSP
jgi:hypothetical protein